MVKVISKVDHGIGSIEASIARAHKAMTSAWRRAEFGPPYRVAALPALARQLELEFARYSTRKMHTSRARLPKKLTFEPGDYVLKSSRRNI